MLEKELNSYRFNSGVEPSDEMLEHIMKEAAKEAKEKKEVAYRQLMEKIQLEVSNEK